MSKRGSNDDETTLSPDEQRRLRNRQSAHRARERKRRRIMEAEQLEKRVMELEKRVCELESENSMLLASMEQMQREAVAGCTTFLSYSNEYYLFPEICV